MYSSSSPSSSSSLSVQSEIPLRVYYADTDAAGVVYYANYLRFCEIGRTEWLRMRSLERPVLAHTNGLVFVVRSVNASYLSPARLDDILTIRTCMSRLGGASITFKQTVLRQAQLLFEADIVLACVDMARMKSVPLPSLLRQTLLNLNA